MYQVDTYLQNTDRYDIGKKSLYRIRRRIKSSGVNIPISLLVGKEVRIMRYTIEELKEMFVGCETAQNIINEQIGDVDVDGRAVAVWYPWDPEHRIPVTAEQIIQEVQDAWDALPLSREDDPCELVDPDDLAALQRIAAEGRYTLRAQYCADEFEE